MRTPSRALGVAGRWRDEAACRSSDPELFFPVGTTGPALEDMDAAKRICETCPVRHQCLQFALETHQDTGIWGGMTEDERRRLRRTRRAASSSGIAVGG